MGFHVKYPKPRKAKGTRFFKLRNYLAAGTLAVCSALGYLIHISPLGQRVYDLIDKGVLDVGEIDRDRRALMGLFLAPHTAKQIIEDQESQGEYVDSVRDRT